MGKKFRKTLIISPHADDELFAFGLLYSRENSFEEIDLLIIGCDVNRQKEAVISSKINNLNLIKLPSNFICKDSFYHFEFEKIREYFTKSLIDYDLIISPLIEGGHQDHDTVTAALFKSKEENDLNAKILLYSAYRSMKNFPLLYRCGIPGELFKNHRYYFTFTIKGFKRFIKTVSVAYKSQYLTWLLLFPFLVIAFIFGNLNYMVIGDNLSLEDILKDFPKKPLYQTYRSLKRSSWFKYINY